MTITPAVTGIHDAESRPPARFMEHERPAEMGSVIVFQAHTRNGTCGRFRQH